MSDERAIGRALALAVISTGLSASLLSRPPRVPHNEYDPAFMGMERLHLGGGRKRKRKAANPAKKAARKRQKKARAITRRSTP